MHHDIQISSWHPDFREAFYRLNRAWIEADYPLEPLDIAVLSDPEKHILAAGGSILAATERGTVVGVVALRPYGGERCYELTKMAVDLPWRSRGIGKMLMRAALDEARRMGATRVILYSNTRTSGPAVQLYRKMGFREIPLEQGVYQRADIKMERLLNTIDIQRTTRSRLPETDLNKLTFGEVVSDHMLLADYRDGVWHSPRIVPFANLEMPPHTLALHYGQIVWEGMKAFRMTDGRVSIFRIPKHIERINRSLERMAMPPMPAELFEESIRTLVDLDAAWAPSAPGSALYIRPLVYASEAKFGVKISETYRFLVFTGPVPEYYPRPIKVKVEERFIRAAPGGTGYAKCAGNYGGAMYPTQLARAEGYDQVLWTDGSPELHIEESGTMNVMFVIDGKVVTPPLSDTILEGITRDSIITLATELGYPVEQRPISAFELVAAHRRGALQEGFGIGTAAVTAPFQLIRVKNEDLHLPPLTSTSCSVRVRQMLQELRDGRRADVYGWNTIVGG
ncbi:MAG: branched-chain amino acid aminotransferase [Thermoanaerobaculia bacterium]|nr:branched-chain amino acid aminotransferase [Thermoanaerobaculia bacterium]